MAIYTISDLHLSFAANKAMDIFGVTWEKHERKIREDWLEKVKEEDLVVLPGDFSWAMYLKDTYLDFEYLTKLPGKKILLKGNHDYWWTTLKKMRDYLKQNNFKNIDFMYNNSYLYENKIIVGTRGWANEDEKDNKKIIERECLRLKTSIKSGVDKYGEDKEIIVFLHYPPFFECKEMISIMRNYNVKKCIYGHIHGKAIKEAFQGEKDGIEYRLVSCDSTDFKLIKM